MYFYHDGLIRSGREHELDEACTRLIQLHYSTNADKNKQSKILFKALYVKQSNNSSKLKVLPALFKSCVGKTEGCSEKKRKVQVWLEVVSCSLDFEQFCSKLFVYLFNIPDIKCSCYFFFVKALSPEKLSLCFTSYYIIYIIYILTLRDLLLFILHRPKTNFLRQTRLSFCSIYLFIFKEKTWSLSSLLFKTQPVVYCKKETQ